MWNKILDKGYTTLFFKLSTKMASHGQQLQ
jgi:hypothetical protein